MSRLNVALDVSAVPSTPAGAGRYVLDLVDALVAGDEAALFLLARRDDVDRWPSRAMTAGVAPAKTPLRLLWGEIGLGAALRRRRGIDVVHGPHYTLPARLPCASVVTVHDLTMLDHPEWHERTKVHFFRRAIRLAADRADVIVTPSELVAEQFQERFGTETPVLAIPHGVDHDRFRTTEPTTGADQAVRKERGIDWPYVLCLGTREPRKNLPALVRAFGRLASERPELRLVIVGGAGWGEALDAEIARSPAPDRVAQLGYVSDAEVASLLRGAAAFAYPSFSEGFGLPVLEALACGAPVVTSVASAMAEVSGDSALLVDPADIDALTDALAELLEGGAAVEERRASGIGRARGYTWEASAQGHLAAYRLAFARRSARASSGAA